ncbi:MAG: hypothetical protein ABR911_06815 [Syntrophales bacterium]
MQSQVPFGYIDEKNFFDHINIGVYVKERIIADKMTAPDQLHAVTESIEFGI